MKSYHSLSIFNEKYKKEDMHLIGIEMSNDEIEEKVKEYWANMYKKIDPDYLYHRDEKKLLLLI